VRGLQWNSQETVVRVRRLLQARGINVWMDIDGAHVGPRDTFRSL
jgi:hypothetical protein